jgi:hypothetical protein
MALVANSQRGNVNMLVMRKVPSPRLRVTGSTSLATRNGPRWRCAAPSRTSRWGCAPAAPCRAADRVPQDSRRCRPPRGGRRPARGSGQTLWRWSPLDRHSLAALRLDGLRQRRRIAGGPGVQHDEEAFLGEFLGYGATVSPGRDERWCRSARPSVGQHSEEVLDEAGYST